MLGQHIPKNGMIVSGPAIEKRNDPDSDNLSSKTSTFNQWEWHDEEYCKPPRDHLATIKGAGGSPEIKLTIVKTNPLSAHVAYQVVMTTHWETDWRNNRKIMIWFHWLNADEGTVLKLQHPNLYVGPFKCNPSTDSDSKDISWKFHSVDPSVFDSIAGASMWIGSDWQLWKCGSFEC